MNDKSFTAVLGIIVPEKVYAAADEETALYELEQFAAKWNSKYPKISASWNEKTNCFNK